MQSRTFSNLLQAPLQIIYTMRHDYARLYMALLKSIMNFQHAVMLYTTYELQLRRLVLKGGHIGCRV